MPELRLAKARSGYDGYVYQPPQSRTVQDVAAKWRAQYEPTEKRSEWFDVDWKTVSRADYRNALLAPSRWQVEELARRVEGGLAMASRISAEWKPNVR